MKVKYSCMFSPGIYSIYKPEGPDNYLVHMLLATGIHNSLQVHRNTMAHYQLPTERNRAY